ncbi:hypothetical protein ACFFNY_29070 [Paenibacillus hodogayensis]|uniref:Glycosyl transferase family 4 n=1 Tax=Paenibacillus hodogayensis TaxID=279208 RepID=A0ABV5W519_9BACL
MNAAVALVLFAGMAGLARLLLPGMLRFLNDHGLTAPNYAGEIIPVGTGAVIVLLDLALYTLFIAGEEWLPVLPGFASTAWLANGDAAAYVLVFAVGWLDDTIGERKVKGLAGHWRQWRRTHSPSTGIVKALLVGTAALWVVARGSGSWAEAGFDWLTIALSANALNLLDVRPGRAWKSFGLGAAVLLATSPLSGCVWMLPALAAGAALLPGDLRGRHMLGDCGSNLLGFTLGCALANAAPVWLQGSALLLLLAMHRTAEKSSITAWIERHKWVRWLDRFGRV